MTIAPPTRPAPDATAARGGAWPAAGVYVADGADIVIEVTARALGAVPVRIRLGGFDASLVVDDDPLNSWLRADLDPTSVRTGLGLRDYVLRGPTVLAVGGYDVVRVESVEITSHQNGRLQVQADVYAKDLVTEVPIHVRLVVPDPDTILLDARTTIDRTALELALSPTWDRLVSRRVDVRAGIALRRGPANWADPS